jgi:hypothetical protein
MFSLKQFNASMKQKPKEVRTLYAFWSAAVVTGILGLIWLVTIPTTLDKIANANENKERPTGNFSNVLQSLRANVIDMTQSFGSAREDIANAPVDSEAMAPTMLNFSTFFDESNTVPDEGVGQAEPVETPVEAITDVSEPVEIETDTVVTATSTSEVVAPTPSGPRQILIGTTSARTSSSSLGE